MTLDKPEHRDFLLEIMVQVNYPGRYLELACEVKRAIESAGIADEQDAANP